MKRQEKNAKILTKNLKYNAYTFVVTGRIVFNGVRFTF